MGATLRIRNRTPPVSLKSAFAPYQGAPVLSASEIMTMSVSSNGIVKIGLSQ
jgi:hypothetical protein